MHIALSREQIHVGRIFTLESRPFPGRSVYVAQKPLGASGNTWSLQRPRENEAEGAARSQFVRVGMFPNGSCGESQLSSWQSCGLGLGSLWACPGFQSRNAIPAGSGAPCASGSQGSGSSCEQESAATVCVLLWEAHPSGAHLHRPRACAGTLLDPYLLQLIIYDYK